MEKDTTQDGNVKQIPIHNYNVDEVDRFLKAVFHSDLGKDENVLVFTSKTNMPGYPITEDEGLELLDRINTPRACYFSIATAVLDEKGRPRNRKNLFKRLHVVVLDDIGTKIDRDSIPDALKPTYIIESSPGNFQWGFVLAEPIDDVDQASLLVKLVFSSGFTDTGGALCNKVVRLPEGVNGKPDSAHGDFRVRLVEMDESVRYTPQQLLDALERSIIWEDAIKDVERTQKMFLAHSQGAAAWTPAALPTAEGVVDPVAEWLYEGGRVKNQTNEWLTIRCPWAHEHSSGTELAGYSPLGWGDRSHKVSRGFHCFHDHCSDRNTQDFLRWVWEQSGLNFPVVEPCYDMSSRYVYDSINNAAWNIKDPGHCFPIPYNNLKGVEKGKVTRFTTTGSLTSVYATAVWHDSLATVPVHGATYKPTQPWAVVKDREGVQRVNTYMPPGYAEHDPDMAQVQPFLDHVRWLIPNDDEHAYFLDWLTCKVQDPGFRGCGIVMVALVEGTGRSTLGDMLRDLFMSRNVETIPFRELVGGSQFNAWVENLLLIVEETLAMESGAAEWRAYDRLKELLDPRTSEVRVNPKHGHHRMSEVCTSFLMFSNHADAIKVPEGARRFYAVQNPDTVRDPQYYADLNTWKNTLDESRIPVWCSHVWNWFMRRPVDTVKMTAPPERSQAMLAMQQASKSALDTVLEAMREYYGDWLPSPVWTHLTQSAFHAALGDVPTSAVRRVWKTHVNTAESVVAKVQGQPMRVAPWRGSEQTNPDHVKEMLRDPNHMKDIEEFVKNKLELAGLL